MHIAGKSAVKSGKYLNNETTQNGAYEHHFQLPKKYFHQQYCATAIMSKISLKYIFSRSITSTSFEFVILFLIQIAPIYSVVLASLQTTEASLTSLTPNRRLGEKK